jgi:hypothetical protein
MKGRPVPPQTDERRSVACLRACDALTTEALESGIIADVFEAYELSQTAIALLLDVQSQGADPLRYVNLRRLLDRTRLVNERRELAKRQAVPS